jgi:hypothetical protein
MSVLRDLQERKEKDFKAQIEKEEIYRAMKGLDHKQLGQRQDVYKKELGKLAQDREAVRVREQEMMKEIEKMEAQMIEKESYFNQ